MHLQFFFSPSMSLRVTIRASLYEGYEVIGLLWPPPQGFCLPQDLMAGDGEGSTQFHDYEGGGIGEGEGDKDVSDKIENEDQVILLHKSGHLNSRPVYLLASILLFVSVQLHELSL